ncbi:MAG: TonB-dependent receptor TonB [Gammaproteobacteria bacterium]|nr:MAG: TonB-dependent receptor TonB [Gammaproteobacteria bacterium]
MKSKVKPTQALLSTAALLTCMAPPLTAVAASNALLLPDATVTGRKIEERLSAELEGIGHHVEVIKGEELEKKGFVDLNKALEALAPGLFVSIKSGRGDYANVKMHGGSEVLWLLDGVRLNNRLYGSGYLDTISVKDIDRIEILKGGEGLFYGTDSQAGVINVITKSVTEKTTGDIGVSYGSGNYTDVSGSVSSTENGHGFRLFASHEQWDGYKLFENEIYARSGNTHPKERGYDRTTIGLKYEKRFDLGKGATLKAHVQRNTGDFDFMRPNEDSAVNSRVEDVQFIKWDHDVSDTFSYYVKAFNHRWWTDYTRQLLDGTFRNNESVWGYEDRGINIMASQYFGEHELLFGIDYQNYWAKDEVWIIDKDRENSSAVFAQFLPYLAFSPETRISIGARYNETEENEITVYNFSIRTPLVAGVNFRGVAGTSFGLPTAEQLYLNDGGTVGNPDLNPEESTNVDVGLEGSFSAFTWELGYFYQRIEDAISYTSDWSTFENAEGKTRIDGFEFQLGTQPINGFSMLFSATTVDARSSGSSQQLARTPEFVAKANLMYRDPSDQYGVDISARYVGDMVQRGLSAYDPFKDEIDYGHYTVVDLSGFYAFGADLSHSISLRLDNLFDENYASGVNRATVNADQFVYETIGLPFTVTASYSYKF